MEEKDNEIVSGDIAGAGSGAKRKPRRADKKVLLVMAGIALAVFAGLLFILFSGDASEKKTAMKSKEALAQEQRLKTRSEQKQKAFAGIKDQLLENPDIQEEENLSGENEKYGDLLQYLNQDPKELVKENVIGQEEINPNPGESLSSNINYEPTAANRERGIYRAGTDLDPKYQKEDYEADKQSFFAFSRSYRGATYFAGQAAQDQKGVNSGGNEDSDPRVEAGEFEGKTEAEIVASLTEKYKKEALALAGDTGASGGKSQKSNKHEQAPPVAIIYNSLTPVKCFQGQNLDCVLLHKLIADTEESPVIAAVSKDFFDASGKYVAIPSGTRVIGRSQVVNYNGASRLYVWFDRIILPNGISVALPQSGNAMDVQGSLGIVSNIDRHFWQKYGSAIFVGLLDGLGGLAQANTSDMQMRYMFGRTSENFGEINKEIMRSNGNIVPTISVNPGHKLKINLSADIIISAFSLISDRSYARR